MNELKKTLWIGLAICLFCSCEKEFLNKNTSGFEYIRHGIFFGECMGYCSKNTIITESGIEIEKFGWDINGVAPKVELKEQINAEFWEYLVQKIDFEAFLQLDTIIGCPDCVDGGGEWIEIKKDGVAHSIMFDFWGEPEAVEPFVGILRAYMHAFEVNTTQAVDFNNRVLVGQKAVVKNFAATRGNPQYLIEIEGDGHEAYFFDKHLYEELKVDGLVIELEAVLGYDSTWISKPATNDIPEPDFLARNVAGFGVKPVEE